LIVWSCSAYGFVVVTALLIALSWQFIESA
jgi:hypothetical protein